METNTQSNAKNRDVPTVLFVTKADLSGEAGDNIATREVVAALAARDDIDVALVCPNPNVGSENEISDSVASLFTYTDPTISSDVGSHLLSSLRLFQALRKAIGETDPDLLIARMAPIMVSPAILSKRNDIPYILLSRGNAYKSLKFSRVLSTIYKYNVRAAAEVYVAANEIKEDTDRYRRQDQSPSTVLSNAVNPDLFEPKAREQAKEDISVDIPPEEFVVGFVGSMKNYHAIEELLESVSEIQKFDDISLLLVGDGPERERFQELADDRSIGEKTYFPGFVSHDEVHEYISACDLLYGISHQSSATPIKCFEYLACERPILVRDIPDLAFVSEHSLGEMVSPIKPGPIAEAIEAVHNQSQEQRDAMGQRGREYVLENRTWDRFVSRILADTLPTVTQSESTSREE